MYHRSIKYNAINQKISKKKEGERGRRKVCLACVPGRKCAKRVDASEPPVSRLINPYEKNMMDNAVVYSRHRLW